jgi:hypothetical protein
MPYRNITYRDFITSFVCLNKYCKKSLKNKKKTFTVFVCKFFVGKFVKYSVVNNSFKATTFYENYFQTA